jgi:hypothetical protein
MEQCSEAYLGMLGYVGDCLHRERQGHGTALEEAGSFHFVLARNNSALRGGWSVRLWLWFRCCIDDVLKALQLSFEDVFRCLGDGVSTT